MRPTVRRSNHGGGRGAPGRTTAAGCAPARACRLGDTLASPTRPRTPLAVQVQHAPSTIIACVGRRVGAARQTGHRLAARGGLVRRRPTAPRRRRDAGATGRRDTDVVAPRGPAEVARGRRGVGSPGLWAVAPGPGRTPCRPVVDAAAVPVAARGGSVRAGGDACQVPIGSTLPVRRRAGRLPGRSARGDPSRTARASALVRGVDCRGAICGRQRQGRGPDRRARCARRAVSGRHSALSTGQTGMARW